MLLVSEYVQGRFIIFVLFDRLDMLFLEILDNVRFLLVFVDVIFLDVIIVVVMGLVLFLIFSLFMESFNLVGFQLGVMIFYMFFSLFQIILLEGQSLNSLFVVFSKDLVRKNSG